MTWYLFDLFQSKKHYYWLRQSEEI